MPAGLQSPAEARIRKNTTPRLFFSSKNKLGGIKGRKAMYGEAPQLFFLLMSS